VLVVGLALGLLSPALSGCSGSVGHGRIRSAEGSITGLTVSGVPGQPPTVRIAAPLHVDRVRTDTIVRGTGAPVVVDTLLVLQLAMYDARTGQKAVSTYDSGQGAMAVKTTDGTLFPALASALEGVRQGSRVVVTLPGAQAYGGAGAPQYGVGPDDPLVLVADVIAVPPTRVLDAVDGAAVAVPAHRPRVVLRDGVPYVVRTRGLAAPTRLRVTTLVRGAGPAIAAGDLVALRTLGQVWDAATPFDDTFTKEPVLVPVGIGKVLPAWDRALVGVPRGSRLLVEAPAADAFGTAGRPPDVPPGAAVVYVLDVLGVSR
jgi:peptidylprolyl isomerase